MIITAVTAVIINEQFELFDHVSGTIVYR